MTRLGNQIRLPSARDPRARRNADDLAGNATFISSTSPIQLNSQGQFVLTLTVNGGLQVLLGALGVLLDPTEPGLQLTSGLKILLATDPGLEFSTGLRVLANAAAAIERTASGIGVNLAANPGLEFDGTNGVRVLVGDGLERVGAGVQIDLATDPGLQFNSGDLRVFVNSDGSLTRDSSGLGVTHWEGGHWNMRSTQNTSATPVEGDFIPIDTSGGVFAATLPTITAANDGRSIAFKKISGDGNTVTINRGSTDTIDGATSRVWSAQFQTVIMTAHNGNSEWYVWDQL